MKREFFGGGGRPGISSVMVDAFNIMQDRITRARLAGDPPDLLITPRVGQFGWFDFHRSEDLIAHGTRANRDGRIRGRVLRDVAREAREDALHELRVHGDERQVLGEREQPFSERALDLIRVAAPKIGSSDATTKERVSGEHHAAFAVLHHEAHAAWSVTGRVDHAHLDAPRGEDAAIDELRRNKLYDRKHKEIGRTLDEETSRGAAAIEEAADDD